MDLEPAKGTAPLTVFQIVTADDPRTTTALTAGPPIKAAAIARGTRRIRAGVHPDPTGG